MIYLIDPRVISWCAMGNGAFIADFPVNKKVNVHNYDELPYRIEVMNNDKSYYVHTMINHLIMNNNR